MFGISDFGAFCAAVLLFLALPGPGTFALITSTGKGGFRAGAAATFVSSRPASAIEVVRWDEPSGDKDGWTHPPATSPSAP